MAKFPVIIAVLVVFILASSTVSPVYAQEEWENAIADNMAWIQTWLSGRLENLENWVSEQVSSASGDVSTISDRMDNLYAFIENLLGASALGRELSVYALTDEGLESVSPLSVSSSLFDNREFSPVYVKQNGMLILWVVDKDTQTPVNGTLDIGMSMFSFSGDGLDPYVMMMLLQQGQGSMFGASLFSFAVSAGVVTVPAMSGFGDTWMATVSSTNYKNFQFVIKIGESPTTPSVVMDSVGSLERGKPGVIMATKGGELVDGTLILPDGTEGTGGMVSFIVPDASSFTVTLKEGGKVTKTQTFYTTDGSSYSPASGGGNDVYLIVFAVIIVLFGIYCIYKRRKKEPLFGGWLKKIHYPR